MTEQELREMEEVCARFLQIGIDLGFSEPIIERLSIQLDNIRVQIAIIIALKKNDNES
jgi:hypothetical protein